MSPVFLLLLFALFSVSLSGYLLSFVRSRKGLAEDFVALGAGAMVGVALIHVFPEAVETDHRAALAFLGGFFFIYLVENFLSVHACVEDHCHYHHASLTSWISITAHTLFDGIAIGASFAASDELGLLVLLGVAIHQVPVSLALWSILTKAVGSVRGRLSAFALFAAAAPIGALVGKTFFATVPDSAILAFALAFSGGSLLYVGASDLLPTVHRNAKNRALVVTLFTLGITLVSVSAVFE